MSRLPEFKSISPSSQLGAAALMRSAGSNFESAMSSFDDVIDESVNHFTERAKEDLLQIEDLDALAAARKETDMSWIDSDQFEKELLNRETKVANDISFAIEKARADHSLDFINNLGIKDFGKDANGNEITPEEFEALKSFAVDNSKGPGRGYDLQQATSLIEEYNLTNKIPYDPKKLKVQFDHLSAQEKKSYNDLEASQIEQLTKANRILKKAAPTTRLQQEAEANYLAAEERAAASKALLADSIVPVESVDAILEHAAESDKWWSLGSNQNNLKTALSNGKKPDKIQAAITGAGLNSADAERFRAKQLKGYSRNVIDKLMQHDETDDVWINNSKMEKAVAQYMLEAALAEKNGGLGGQLPQEFKEEDTTEQEQQLLNNPSSTERVEDPQTKAIKDAEFEQLLVELEEAENIRLQEEALLQQQIGPLGAPSNQSGFSSKLDSLTRNAAQQSVDTIKNLFTRESVEENVNAFQQGIIDKESGGDPSIINHKAVKYFPEGYDVTKQPAGEVNLIQKDAVNKQNRAGIPEDKRTSAVGKYQTNYATVKWGIDNGYVNPKRSYDEPQQDNLLYAILYKGKRPNITAYITNKIKNPNKAIISLGKEWEGLSVAKGNITRARAIAILNSLKRQSRTRV